MSKIIYLLWIFINSFKSCDASSTRNPTASPSISPDTLGYSWTVTSAPSNESQHYNGVACDSTGQFVIASIENNFWSNDDPNGLNQKRRIYRSTDFGKSWHVLFSAYYDIR